MIIVTLPSNIADDGQVKSSADFQGQKYDAGDTIRVELSYGQTAQFQATTINDNLNGALIESSKPISVFSGNGYFEH